MKIGIYTLGCKVNQYETQAMEQELTARGHELVDFESPADAYIINTCSVTAVSDKKSRQMIRRAKKNSPDAVVAACGCYVQTHEKEAKSLGIFNEVVGFYPATSNIIAANKAYLLKSALPAGAQSAASLFFNWTTTGLTEATTGKKAERYYDLNGRLVPYPTTGVYINGEGKKVFIKK